MDFTLKEIFVGLAALVIYVINHYIKKHDAKKEKVKEQEQREVDAKKLQEQLAADAKKLQEQRESDALKLAETTRKQLEEHAAQLKKDLVIAAEKLAQETARQIHEKEQRDAEEALRLEHAKSLAVIEEIDKKVRHAIKGILFRFHAQRGYVIHWSNGTETAAGLHLMKITFKHEALENFTVEPVSKYYREKHLPEMFTTPMKKTLSGADYYLKDSEDPNELDVRDPNCKAYRAWLESYKVRSTLWIPIKSPSGIIIAILVIQWYATTHLDDTELAKIRDMKSEIEDHYRPLQKVIISSSGTSPKQLKK